MVPDTRHKIVIARPRVTLKSYLVYNYTMSPVAKNRVVKVKYEVYRKLLRLQSKLQLSLGRRVSFSEVIDRLLAHQEEADPTNSLIGGEAGV
jgi:hypothetical protein